jgi:hypothetical protein
MHGPQFEVSGRQIALVRLIRFALESVIAGPTERYPEWCFVTHQGPGIPIPNAIFL